MSDNDKGPERKAWLDGLRAREANQPRNSNPHLHVNTTLEAEWDNGWFDTDTLLKVCHV